MDSLRKAEDIIIDVWPPSHDFGMNLFFEVETLLCYVLLYIVDANLKTYLPEIRKLKEKIKKE